MSRSMGRWDLVAIVINAVVGAGILGLPGRMFAALGRFSVGAWLLCALIMAMITLCVAEVSSHFESTGGVYRYAHATIGPTTGFMVGWLAWVSRLFSLATIGNLVITYVGGFNAPLVDPSVRIACVTLMFAALAGPLLLGIRRSALVNNALTALKLILLGGFALTLFCFDASINGAPRPFPGTSAWQAAMLQMSFAFIGVESVTINAAEMRNPGRDVPFALAVGFAVIASLYLAIQIACIGTVPDLALSEQPVIDAAARILGLLGGRLVGVGGVICMLGTMYAVILTGSRLPFALAENGQLPARLAGVRGQSSGTPVLAILLTTLLAWALTLYTSFIGALTLTATTRLVGYITTCIALVILRRRHAGGLRIPAAGLAVWPAMLACAWLMFATNLAQLMSLGSIGACGLAVYWATINFAVRKSRTHPGQPPQS